MSEAFEQPKGAMSCISYKNFELHVTGFLGFLVSYVSIAMLACKLSHQTWQTYKNISLSVLTLTLDVLEMHYSLLGQIHAVREKSLRGRGSCHSTCHRQVRLPVAAATAMCACHTHQPPLCAPATRTSHRYVRLPHAPATNCYIGLYCNIVCM